VRLKQPLSRLTVEADPMISQAALSELRSRNPCHRMAAQYVKLRPSGSKFIGPCPIHSTKPQARDSTSFDCDADGWRCAVCHDGGDVIKLVALCHGLNPRADFLEAVRLLGGTAKLSPERAAEFEHERQIRQSRRDSETNEFRERERRKAFDLWNAGERWHGTTVEQYLKLRGLERLPEGLPLRYAPMVAYFHGEHVNAYGRKAPRPIYRGRAMLAAITDASGVFRAVHCTWLDLDRPDGKAHVLDPDTGEELPSKKVRGSKNGNVIRLVDAGTAASRLVIGEGVETVVSVWSALMQSGHDVAATSFWSAIDLGNLAGKAAASIPHPILKDGRGRPRRVSGPKPDFAAPGIIIPSSVNDVILLGDGDSDRFNTQCSLVRASLRFALSAE
jgi:CHC2 zinc finger